MARISGILWRGAGGEAKAILHAQQGTRAWRVLPESAVILRCAVDVSDRRSMEWSYGGSWESVLLAGAGAKVGFHDGHSGEKEEDLEPAVR